MEQIKLLLCKKTVCGSFRKEIAMGKCKTKTIQTDLGTFRHNQTYPGIIQAYSEPCVALTYLKLCYIQNPDIFRTRDHIQNPGIFRTLVYSERCHIQNPRHIQNPDPTVERFTKIVNGYYYFQKL